MAGAEVGVVARPGGAVEHIFGHPGPARLRADEAAYALGVLLEDLFPEPAQVLHAAAGVLDPSGPLSGPELAAFDIDVVGLGEAPVPRLVGILDGGAQI